MTWSFVTLTFVSIDVKYVNTQCCNRPGIFRKNMCFCIQSDIERKIDSLFIALDAIS